MSEDAPAGAAGQDAPLRLPADASAAPRARAHVRTALSDAGLGALADDASLVVSELVSNAVLHARSAVGVRVLRLDDQRARLEVEDSSTVVPTFGLMDTRATSGRGLLLVDAVSTGWGVDVDPGRGKTVWVELSTAAGDPFGELTAEDLLERWADLPGHDEPDPDPAAAGAPGEEVTVRLEGVPVAALRAAKLHVEDTVRDLQLVLLSDAYLPGDADGTGAAGRSRTSGAPSTVSAAVEEVRLARRLDAAAEEFGDGRRQVRAAVMEAAATGQERATLTLHLPRSAAGAASRYLQVMDEADALVQSGRLLLARQLAEHADLRRWYLHEILRQLEGSPAQGSS